MSKGSMTDKIVTVNIGKKGINDNLVNEINMILKKRGVVKVKMLRNFRNMTMGGVDRKALAREIAGMIDGELVDVRGFVMMFKRC